MYRINEHLHYLHSHVQYESCSSQAPQARLASLHAFAQVKFSSLVFLNAAAVWRELPFTGRGRRAWNRGCPACRAAIQRCRARRWPCPSKWPARSRTPPRTGGPRCWRDTPGWRLPVSCWEMRLRRGRQSQD